MSNSADRWPYQSSAPKEPPPKAMISCRLATNTGHSHVERGSDMVTTEWLVTNGQVNNFVMGISSVKREHYHDVGEPRGDGEWVLRYTWLVNGIPMHMKVFNSDKNGNMGRLIREGSASISELEWKRFKK